MKIQHVETNLVCLPLEEPLVGAPPFPAMMREFVTVRLRTDDGLEGYGTVGVGSTTYSRFISPAGPVSWRLP